MKRNRFESFLRRSRHRERSVKRQLRMGIFLIISSAALGALNAQVKPNDFSQRAEQIEDLKVSKAVKTLRRNTSISQETIKPRVIGKIRSNLASVRAPVTVSETRTKKIKNFPVQKASGGRPKSWIFENRRAHIPGWSKGFRAVDRTIQSDIPSVKVQSGSRGIENAFEKLTLDDFNRFQFRRNRSGGDGIPIQRAGRKDRRK